MLPYQTLILIDKNAATPVYQQIANRLVGLIRDGIIKPGSFLPASREMATLLQLHRKTVVAAYDELIIQGWVETIPRKGVIVPANLPEIKPRTFNASFKIPAYAGSTGFTFNKIASHLPPPTKNGVHRIIINDGFPDTRMAPVDLLMKEYKNVFHNPAARNFVMYGDLAGSLNLRTSIAKFLTETRGLNISATNILLSRGAQMAIFMAARMILRPGSIVLVGASNYFMADMVFEQFGAKLVRIPVDENGMDIDAIEKICKTKIPDLLYIIPHHHHPTTVTLSAERRMKLLSLIRKYRFPVIEDDYDYDFHYSSSPILPLASADHGGNVIYIGSLTKSLSPAIRVGYTVAPVNFIIETAQLRRMIDIRGDNLLEEALAVLLDKGDIQRHIKKSLKIYQVRRDMLCYSLEKKLGNAVSFSKPAGGLAIWVQFKKRYSLPKIAARASAEGLFMNDGSIYSYGSENQNALRMGFASLNEQEINKATDILGDIIRQF